MDLALDKEKEKSKGLEQKVHLLINENQRLCMLESEACDFAKKFEDENSELKLELQFTRKMLQDKNSLVNKLEKLLGEKDKELQDAKKTIEIIKSNMDKFQSELDTSRLESRDRRNNIVHMPCDELVNRNEFYTKIDKLESDLEKSESQMEKKSIELKNFEEENFCLKQKVCDLESQLKIFNEDSNKKIKDFENIKQEIMHDNQTQNKYAIELLLQLSKQLRNMIASGDLLQLTENDRQGCINESIRKNSRGEVDSGLEIDEPENKSSSQIKDEFISILNSMKAFSMKNKNGELDIQTHEQDPITIYD